MLSYIQTRMLREKIVGYSWTLAHCIGPYFFNPFFLKKNIHIYILGCLKPVFGLGVRAVAHNAKITCLGAIGHWAQPEGLDGVAGGRGADVARAGAT